jgi:hypothetical protein
MLIANIFLKRILYIVSCICGKILKFTLRQDLIIRLIFYLLTHSYSLIIKVRRVVRICIELASYFELLRMLYLFGRRWLLVE